MNALSEDMTTQHFLQFLLTRNPRLDKDRLQPVLPFLIDAHRNQFRKSGTPYTEHPLEVAKILATLQLDTETIIAGLLHDVVEDTEYELEDIQDRFGSEVAFMVDAVTKIEALQSGVATKEEKKMATYRKFLVSMAKDPRVIMIKLADRLHNLRTLRFMRPEKRKEIARETLEIYAPLTHRFGLHRIKWELEDLALKNMDPEGYRSIIEKLQQSRKKREAYLASVITPLEIKMALENFNCQIQGRPKHIYSIYHKIKARNCTVDDLFDLFAIRIIVSSIPDCYIALGYVHNMWPPLQSRFKDYIATPKPNLYQSLHTTVIGPDGKMVEVQIRTQDMDKTAEHGFAAHWAYKLEDEESNLEWLHQMAEAQSEITDSKEFFEFLHLDLKPQEMVVFTPKGDPVSLPIGATVLDFAFAVHTELGYHCVGARLDDQVVGIENTLSHGATVHILRNNQQEPAPDWHEIVVTHKAKQALRRKLRSYQTEQAYRIGKAIYERELHLSQISLDYRPSEEQICTHFNCHSLDAFYESIGRGNHTPENLENFLLPFSKQEPSRKKDRTLLNRFLRRNDGEEMAPLLIDSTSSLLVHFAECCNPVAGDKIVGLLNPGKGFSIHKENCRHLKHSSHNRIAVAWRHGDQAPMVARIEIHASDRDGLAEDLMRTFRHHKVSIERGSFVTIKDLVRDRFQVKVYNLSQLEATLQALRQIPGVKKVIRQ